MEGIILLEIPGKGEGGAISKLNYIFSCQNLCICDLKFQNHFLSTLLIFYIEKKNSALYLHRKKNSSIDI